MFLVTSLIWARFFLEKNLVAIEWIRPLKNELIPTPDPVAVRYRDGWVLCSLPHIVRTRFEGVLGVREASLRRCMDYFWCFYLEIPYKTMKIP